MTSMQIKQNQFDRSRLAAAAYGIGIIANAENATNAVIAANRQNNISKLVANDFTVAEATAFFDRYEVAANNTSTPVAGQSPKQAQAQLVNTAYGDAAGLIGALDSSGAFNMVLHGVQLANVLAINDSRFALAA